MDPGFDQKNLCYMTLFYLIYRGQEYIYHPWPWAARCGGHLRVKRSQQVKSQQICLGNQVRDPEHEIWWLASSSIQKVKPELSQVSRGSVRIQGQEARKVRYPENQPETVAAQTKGIAT